MLTLIGAPASPRRDLEHAIDQSDVVHPPERGVIERVEADRDALEAGAARSGRLTCERAVGRQRQIAQARERRDHGDQAVQVAAHERLAAGDADLLHTGGQE
jgi:hypothetical protein